MKTNHRSDSGSINLSATFSNSSLEILLELFVVAEGVFVVAEGVFVVAEGVLVVGLVGVEFVDSDFSSALTVKILKNDKKSKIKVILCKKFNKGIDKGIEYIAFNLK
jgi:hypothetical protein